MAPSSAPIRRLQSVANHTAASALPANTSLLLVLPDGGKVHVSHLHPKDMPNEIYLDGTHILTYTVAESHNLAFDIAAVGTPFQGNTKHIPKYSLLTLSAPSPTSPARPTDLPLAYFWVGVYALFTLYHTQEHIPITFSSSAFPNTPDITRYLLDSGLARLFPPPAPTAAADDILFLSRASFWQGAGTAGYHTRAAWLLTAPRPAAFPAVPSYTRTARAIAAHPLRPPKPPPGAVLYRRFCSAVRQTLTITAFDLDGVHDASLTSHTTAGNDGGVSTHLAAFHKWHNDPRVNAAWGERGDLPAHRAYIETLLADPHAQPCMLSWDGALFGYVEIVYTKEDHVAQHYPPCVVPGQWERGIHVLVGEPRFLGGGRSELWLRCLAHYIFLADPRTDRVVGEPSSDNAAIARAVESAGFHCQTTFDFPYKRSRLYLLPREKFFNLCQLS